MWWLKWPCRAAYTRGVSATLDCPMSRPVFVALFTLALAPAAHAAADCSTASLAQPLPLPTTAVAPASAELYTRSVQLGMPAGVLATSYDSDQSVDRVLLRLRVEGCQQVANALPAAAGTLADDPAAYKPQTAFDNTPWRFNMNQNGKRMTADEFDAWMKSRGVRVVKARPAAAPAAVEAQAADPVQKQ